MRSPFKGFKELSRESSDGAQPADGEAGPAGGLVRGPAVGARRDLDPQGAEHRAAVPLLFGDVGRRLPGDDA